MSEMSETTETIRAAAIILSFAFSFIIFSISLSIFSVASSAQASASTNPPIPALHPYVNDLAGVLTSDDISSINALAAQIEQNTTVQIAVLTINSTQPLTIEQYANEVFRANGIGHRDNNNGLLIVAALSDRRWRFETGYGLEGVLPDALTGQIGLTYLTPNFRSGDYGTGLYDAVQSVGTILETGNDPYIISQDNSSNGFGSSLTGLDLFFNFFPFIVIIFVPIIFFASNDISRCPKCGKITFGKVQRGGGSLGPVAQDDKVVFVCKNGHRWTKKKKRAGFWPIFIGGGGGGWGGGGGGGGGFGGGSSGGGGASGGY